MFTRNNFLTIQGWMITDLKLKGNALIVYATIYGFSQNGEAKFTGSLQYIADILCSDKRSTMRVLQRLTNDGLIVKEDNYINNVKNCTYSINIEKLNNILHCNTGGIDKMSTPMDKMSTGGIDKMSTPMDKMSTHINKYILKDKDNIEDKENNNSVCIDSNCYVGKEKDTHTEELENGNNIDFYSFFEGIDTDNLDSSNSNDADGFYKGKRELRQVDEATYEDVKRDFNIVEDNYTGDFNLINWTNIYNAYVKSKRFLQANEQQKCLSWICKNYKSIEAGKYTDRETLEEIQRRKAREQFDKIMNCQKLDGG